MKITEIEKLNQLISRTDMTGNEKVEWLKTFIAKREKKLLTGDANKSSLTKTYEIDFDTNVLARIEITNNKPTVTHAMSGWGNAINKDGIIINEK
ncbi:MAG: hypothetical protein ACK5LM_07745 [Lactovum sp.]